MTVLAAMPKYEAYKDSGVEWIGDISSDWDIKPGFIAYSENKRNNKGLKEEKVLSLSYGKIIVKAKEKLVGLVPESFETYQIVEPGDIIIRCMDLQNDKTSLRIGLAENHGIITSAYLNLKVKSNFNPKFIYYYLHSLDTTKVLYKFGTGLRQNLSFSDFYRLPIFDISKSLQTDITNYLDNKTAQIDEAIAIKKKQIELLKERKQILIQKAVTQGLDPNIPMRDSGVDWIGEIPEHWELKRLKYVVSIIKRIIGYEGPDVLSITQRGIKVKDISSGEGQLAMNYSKYQIVNRGDFAMNHMDLLTGYVDISKFDGVISPDYRVFTSINKEVDDQYLLLLFQIGYKHKVFYGFGQGVSLLGRWRLPADNFNNFKIMIPPLKEQLEVSRYINDESVKIDNTAAIQQKQIEKLKEYKTTLINSAVTGKIKIEGNADDA
ncbi:MAG: restriction endonuclease subunit S [Methylococcales bacterium]|nr:restriction endonuclease subunit S [Methylococcales bacterium]